MPRFKPITDRVFDHYTPEPNTGCWLWTGIVDVSGYGILRAYADSRPRFPKAHRIIYEFMRGPIPEGMQIDHLCRVRCCINPDHMEVVTLQENLRRGIGIGPALAGRAAYISNLHECKRGHAFDAQNTQISFTKTGKVRRCRACGRLRANESNRKKRAQEKNPPPVCL